MDNGSIMTIGSHSETMVAEQQNVSNSKIELESKYNDYVEDNQALVIDWQGDTADIFAQFSKNMNDMLKEAISTTDVFGININNFYSKSYSLDTQASSSMEVNG